MRLRPASAARSVMLFVTLAVTTACGSPRSEDSSELAASNNGRTSNSSNVQQSQSRYACAFDKRALQRRMDDLSLDDRWLAYSENRPGENSSGHAMQKHVSKDETWLRGRLSREPNISGSSSYPDVATAEALLEKAFESRFEQIATWLANPRSDRKLSFTESCDGFCGISLRRNARQPTLQTTATVVLHKECTPTGLSFFVLTSYPGT